MRKIKTMMVVMVLVLSQVAWAQTPVKQANTKVGEKTKTEDYTVAFSRIDSTKIPEVIAEIERRREETEASKAFFESTKGVAVGMVGMMPFIMVIIIVLSVQYFRYKKKKDLNLLISKIIESGKDIPFELLHEPKKKSSDLRKGLVILSIGLAMMLGGYMINKNLIWIGFLPFLLGVAFIASHFLVKSEE